MFYIQGFYKIKFISNCNTYKAKIKKYLLCKSVKGTVILSPEGINGTIAGEKNNVKDCLKFIKGKLRIKILIVSILLFAESNLFIEPK